MVIPYTAFFGADRVIAESGNIARDELFDGLVTFKFPVRGNVISLDLVKLDLIKLLNDVACWIVGSVYKSPTPPSAAIVICASGKHGQ